MPPKSINYLADHHCSVCRAKGSCSLPPQAARVTGSYSEKGKSCFYEGGLRGAWGIQARTCPSLSIPRALELSPGVRQVRGSRVSPVTWNKGKECAETVASLRGFGVMGVRRGGNKYLLGFAGGTALLGIGCQSSKLKCSRGKCCIPHIQGLPHSQAQQAAPEQPQSHLHRAVWLFLSWLPCTASTAPRGSCTRAHLCKGPGTHSKKYPRQTG